MGNYIKIDRKILEWEWYSNINTCRLFIHMLLKANWKDGKFEGKVVPRGSFISSYPTLERETQLTNREIRTAIEHLKTTGELTVQKTNRYSIFTINNYNLYQVSDSQSDRQATDKRQSNVSLTSAIEEKKEIKEENNNINEQDNLTQAPTSKKQIDEFFEEIWKMYPKKRGKAQVSDAKKRSLYEIGIDELTRAINRYKAECDDVTFMQYGSTFFNSGYVDYLDANYTEIKQGGKKQQNKTRSFPQREYGFENLERKVIAAQNKNMKGAT